MIAPPYLRVLNNGEIKKWIDQKCDMNCRIRFDSTNEIVYQFRWNRKFRLTINIYIIKLCGVKYNLMNCLMDSTPPYLVVWQN
jgi:hypothetical protein